MGEWVSSNVQPEYVQEYEASSDPHTNDGLASGVGDGKGVILDARQNHGTTAPTPGPAVCKTGLVWSVIDLHPASFANSTNRWLNRLVEISWVHLWILGRKSTPENCPSWLSLPHWLQGILDSASDYRACVLVGEWSKNCYNQRASWPLKIPSERTGGTVFHKCNT